MPYHVKKRGSKYCAVKVGGTKTLGCHDTHAQAVAQVQAVNLSELAQKMIVENVIKHFHEKFDK